MAREKVGDFLLVAAAFEAADESFARLIPHDSPTEHADYLATEARAGRLETRRVLRGGQHVGNLFFTVESGRARELVLVAAYCRGPTLFSPTLSAMLLALASDLACVSVRFHTVRAGAVRAARGLGWRASEIVMRIDVPS